MANKYGYIDYSTTNEDFSKAMLNAKNYEEFAEAADRRDQKAYYQGIDTSGNGNVRSNEQIYQEWRNANKDNPNAGIGWSDDGSTPENYMGSGFWNGVPDDDEERSTRGGSGGGSSKKSGDFSQYLKDQYAAQIESQLAGLKTAYENSMNGYNASMERLPQQYATARNNAAAQDAIARKQFDERAVANGLNTGTSGQAELARESTYRGNIADIDSAEGNAKADLDLQMKNLQSQYESAIAKAEADGKANLANALYQEMVRAQNYALQKQSAAQQQANWEAQFAFQQQQYADALAQQQREWDFTQQQYADKQAAAAAKVAARYTPSYTPTQTPTPTPTPEPTPAPAATSYTPNASGFSAMGLETILNRDGGQAAQEYLNKYWDGMSNAEKTRAQLVFNKYA